jgi:replicative superfamily II helicase
MASASGTQSSYTHSEIDSHAYLKSSEISPEFRDVFAYSTDVIKIFINAFKKQDEFSNFINAAPADGGIWNWQTGQTSLVIMVLAAYATAWEMLMNAIKNEKERKAVSDLYGEVLSCFVEGGIIYEIDGKQSDEEAERVCAVKLRHAIAHSHMKVAKQESPWTMEFRTDWKKKIHCFQITPRGLYSFLSLFNNFSRFGYITGDSIRTMLKGHVSENECFRPQKLIDLSKKY